MRTILALTMVAALAAAPASAAVITYTHIIPTSTVPFTDDFTLQAFDTSLGTLASIEITLNLNSTAEVDIFNATASAKTFSSARASVPVSVTGPAGVSTSQTVVAGPFSGSADPGFNTFPGITGTASSSVFVALADFLSYETPPAGVDLSFSFVGAAGNYSGSSVAGVFFSGNATLGGTVDIIYTTVPEPATLAVLGIGLAGLCGVRRRRR